jgi:hypothetical protein
MIYEKKQSPAKAGCYTRTMHPRYYDTTIATILHSPSGNRKNIPTHPPPLPRTRDSPPPRRTEIAIVPTSRGIFVFAGIAPTPPPEIRALPQLEYAIVIHPVGKVGATTTTMTRISIRGTGGAAVAADVGRRRRRRRRGRRVPDPPIPLARLEVPAHEDHLERRVVVVPPAAAAAHARLQFLVRAVDTREGDVRAIPFLGGRVRTYNGVGMVLTRQFAIRALDHGEVAGGEQAAQSQYRVRIRRRRRSRRPGREGRRRRGGGEEGGGRSGVVGEVGG